jgi:N-acetylmuramoyl-L-alanine amidase
VSDVTADGDWLNAKVCVSKVSAGCCSYALTVLLVCVVVGCQGSESGEAPREPTAVVPKLEPVPISDGELPNEPEQNDGPLPTELRITELARYGSHDTARIVVFLNRPARYEVGKLAAGGGKGPRLFLDIDRASYSGSSQFDVGGVVERVRLGQQGDAVRVVLDLREQVSERVFFLPEPFRLIIDVASAREGSRLGSARIGKEITRVVLDAGHGGHDPGAIGASGLMEKDVALDVALRAAPLIARELGVSALLTRETDEFVPLDERVARANAFNADLFVSLHCNASHSADGHGVMTFVLDSSRDQVALQVAARENDASEAASTQLAKAMSQVMDTTTSRASEGFARLLQRASLASLGDDYPGVWDGGVRRAGFYVLAGAHMPAVLFEMSFISNPTEELRLESPGYRQSLADGVVNAIRAYKSGL